jgi:hypothetical protein
MKILRLTTLFSKVSTVKATRFDYTLGWYVVGLHFGMVRFQISLVTTLVLIDRCVSLPRVF